jgi:hypothetical protein
VIGTALGLRLLGLDILPDAEGGRGHTHFAPLGAWFQPDPGRLSRRERDAVERVLTTFAAGFASEERLGEADPDGSGYDIDQALREWLAYLEPARERRADLAREFYSRAARELDRPERWQAVETLAAALLERSRLSAEEALAIIAGEAKP